MSGGYDVAMSIKIINSGMLARCLRSGCKVASISAEDFYEVYNCLYKMRREVGRGF
jgi:hypothetical protein